MQIILGHHKGMVFNSQYLLNHITEQVLPMIEQHKISSEPSIFFLVSPEMMTLDTESELVFVKKLGSKEHIDELSQAQLCNQKKEEYGNRG